MPVPLMDTVSQYSAYADELKAAAARIIDSGKFVLGENVAAFEREAAEHIGVKHAIGVGNGTDALTIAMRALGVGAGDEVICPSYTFYATAETIAELGAVPVFADVEPRTATLDVSDVRARITPRTKAIIPVHLFGQCADMGALRAICTEHDLALLEDAAQAWGARQHGVMAGALGDAATFSFYPTKNLPAFGDGGLITTNDDAVAETARLLRFHGSKDKRTFEMVGYNSRLDELQAAFLRQHLTHIAEWNAHRRTVAGWYEELGLGELVELPAVGDGNEPIWHLYVVRSEHREALIAGLHERGIGAMVYYANSLHQQPVFADTPQPTLPVTEQLATTGVAIPMFPTMTREQAEEVVTAVAASVPARVG